LSNVCVLSFPALAQGIFGGSRMKSLDGWPGTACLVVVLLLPGCGAPATGEVSGQVMALHPVTRQLTLVRSGTISFYSTPDADPVLADIQPDGSYRLEGMPTGEVIVTVESPEVEGQPGFDRKTWFPLHPQYGDVTRTPLRFKIVGGSQTLPIQLTEPAPLRSANGD
jgi:hypothetical protein